MYYLRSGGEYSRYIDIEKRSCIRRWFKFEGLEEIGMSILFSNTFNIALGKWLLTQLAIYISRCHNVSVILIYGLMIFQNIINLSI